ncbi:MAG TPA: cupin domain-containing protein [Firmicutes bacterium]|nr:cupin domain-containing protein [Bacillota bacterium]
MIVENVKVRPTSAGPGVERKILASMGSLMSVEVKFEKGAVGAVHTHPHEQVSYVVRGSFEFELEGKKTIIKTGDSYYVKPGVAHGVVALEDSVILDIFTPQREDFLK